VLHEFYNIGTRKLQPALPHEQAVQAINFLCEFIVVGSSAASVQAALSLVNDHQLSWCDALILEAAIRADADVLVSEDGHHDRRFDRLRVENPFV
jgi:predicted nucleic acid-binding protein